MDSKESRYTVVLCFLLIHGSSTINHEYEFVIANFDYYLSIKSSGYKPQAKPWMDKFGSYCGDDWMIKKRGPCKIELDEEDTCLLYLVKNQSSAVALHGPVEIDPKLIDLDVKYDPSKVTLSNFKVESYDNEKQFESCIFQYARCVLSKVTYQHLGMMEKFPVLNTHLELENKIADLFPKVEKNDYFLLNIINKNYNRTSSTHNLVSSHIISNYTIL
uniref:Uncharacterized protein n=1 Tax=Tetranychus urticae TaxID=32264 RepID=T1K9H0_TETUR